MCVYVLLQALVVTVLTLYLCTVLADECLHRNTTEVANGTTLYSQDENDFEKALNTSGSFAKILGLRITKHKTDAMWTGR